MPGRLFYPLVFLLLLSSAVGQTTAAAPPGPVPAPAPGPGFHSVSFENAGLLSSLQQQAITRHLQDADPNWVASQSLETLAAFVQNMVLVAYQDNGYWRAKVSAKVTWVAGEDPPRHVDVIVTALNEGDQYWLRDVRWTGATVFQNDELLGLMPIHRWDLMSRTKVAEGLDTIHKLYASRGYLAFSAVPQVDFDDQLHCVSLNIAVQEDSPFHFGNLSVSGMDRAVSKELQQEWVQLREQAYSPEKLREFFAKFLPPLPPGTDPLDYSTSNVDLDTHTVDILLSFSPTTQAEKSEQ